MQKFPFSATGFNNLQQQLYALPDEQLLLEADLIKNNFEHWMADHFELSQTQVIFLNAIDRRAKSLLAFETSFAVGNRLPITLFKADPPADDEDEQGKIIWPKSTLTALWGLSEPYIASGTLEIHIAYQSLG